MKAFVTVSINRLRVFAYGIRVDCAPPIGGELGVTLPEGLHVWIRLKEFEQ